MRVLDSHLHLWDPSRLDYEWLEGPLARRYAAEELTQAPADGDAPHAAIFVQAECVETQFLDEVRWVSGIAAPIGVLAIVAGARLDRGDETIAHLDALSGFSSVVGVRHLLQGSPAGTALSPTFLAGARALAERGLRFDVCVRSDQLPDAVALAEAVPALPMVLDHLGKPEIGTAQRPLAPAADWLRSVRALAEHPQVVVKLSGLPAETGGRWSCAQVVPFLDAAAEAFGPHRLLWGSDWPVSSVSDAYRAGARAEWLRTVADWAGTRGLDPEAVLRRNAERFYGVA